MLVSTNPSHDTISLNWNLMFPFYSVSWGWLSCSVKVCVIHLNCVRVRVRSELVATVPSHDSISQNWSPIFPFYSVYKFLWTWIFITKISQTKGFAISMYHGDDIQQHENLCNSFELRQSKSAKELIVTDSSHDTIFCIVYILYLQSELESDFFVLFHIMGMVVSYRESSGDLFLSGKGCKRWSRVSVTQFSPDQEFSVSLYRGDGCLVA